MEPSGWRVELTSHARRDLRKPTRGGQEQIEAALEGLTTGPPPAELRELRELRGEQDQFRLRVGVWRVSYRRDRATRGVVIPSVDDRREAYQGD